MNVKYDKAQDNITRVIVVKYLVFEEIVTMRQIMLVSAILIGFFVICAQATSIIAAPVTPLSTDEAVALAVDYAHNQLKNDEHMTGGFVGHNNINGNIILVCVLNVIKDTKTYEYREEDYLVFVDKNTKSVTQSYIISLDNKSLSKINPATLKEYKENCADGNDIVSVESSKK